MDLIDDLKQQLEDLRVQVERSNPELYRQLALYLQVLRSGLLNAVQQACFHLATERYAQRYGALDGVQRRQLHQRLVSLVARTSSLLTVEQLVQLAGQLERNRRKELDADRSQLLSALASAAHSAQSVEEPSPSADGGSPAGSVHLGMALPLSTEMFSSRAFPGLLPMPGQPTGIAEDGSLPDEERLRDDAPLELQSPTDQEALETLAAIQAMQAAFGQIAEPNGRPEVDSPEEPSPGASGSELSGSVSPSTPVAPWDGATLPTDPVNLMVWLDGFERALVRRLRNLSHAINVDLLRLGLSRSLLPLNLLDAVLRGQLETQSAPANVLALPLPLGQQPMGRSLETASILLRLSDLEFDQPKLRTCRSRLQQQRQEVRRMAQHYRRLWRRLQGLEAEQLWLQDVSTVGQTSRDRL